MTPIRTVMLKKKKVHETSFFMLSAPKTLGFLQGLTISRTIISPLAPLLCSYSLILTDVKCCFAFSGGEQASVRHFGEIPFRSRKKQPRVPGEKQCTPLFICGYSNHVSCIVLFVAGSKNNKCCIIYLAQRMLIRQGHL